MFTVSVVMNTKKIFKEEKLFEILKIIRLIDNIEGYQEIYIISEKNINQELI